MTRRSLVLALLAACGSQPERTMASTPTARSGPSDAELRAEREHREREEHKAIVSKHRVLESAQQDALGATCEDLTRWAPQRYSFELG